MAVNERRLEIPPGSERFIALQRTAYQHPVNLLFRALRLGTFYDSRFLPWIESRRSPVLQEKYAADLRRDYDSIRSALPESARKILDIGAGISGIDLFLYQHYGSSVDLYLLDKEEVARNIYYGYKSRGAFYNSLELARDFLTTNGVAPRHIHPLDIVRDGFPSDQRFDLVISLISWGYHYPIAAYASEVDNALVSGGTLIVDTRRGTSAKDELQALFGRASRVLLQTTKFERVVVHKP